MPQPARPALLFHVLRINMLTAGVPSYRARSYLVPEGRALELVTREDLDAWATHGFRRHGRSDEQLEATEQAVQAAIRAFDAADWVVKIDHNGGAVDADGAGFAVTRVFVQLPDSV